MIRETITGLPIPRNITFSNDFHIDRDRIAPFTGMKIDGFICPRKSNSNRDIVVIEIS